MAAFFAYIATTAYAEVDYSKAARLESQWAQVALAHLISFEQSQHRIRALQTCKRNVLGKLNNTEYAMTPIQRDNQPRSNAYRHTAPTHEPHDD